MNGPSGAVYANSFSGDGSQLTGITAAQVDSLGNDNGALTTDGYGNLYANGCSGQLTGGTPRPRNEEQDDFKFCPRLIDECSQAEGGAGRCLLILYEYVLNHPNG